jgi:hypothetical protein
MHVTTESQERIPLPPVLGGRIGWRSHFAGRRSDEKVIAETTKACLGELFLEPC